ncbi:hypothetical protein [Micromonospora sp. NPDC048063]|uniref:hypothetical protein n=1 Tax=Micromonospora sp. NPDC048063 TaxID=3364256 RepID=UPI00371F4E39
MPSYDSLQPQGRAGFIVRSAENSFTDPIADLLQQIEADIELESSPDRRRAESRLADQRLVEQVRFEMTLKREWDGVAHRQLFNDLWLYALPVVKAFLKRNKMRQVLQRYAPERAVPMRPEDMVVLANSDEARTELALDIIAAAVENFRHRAIGQRKWKASMGGASLRTYFIGTCALAFPRAYKKWSKARAGELERLATQHEIDFEEIGGIIARDLADPAAIAGIRVDLQKIVDLATPTTKLILGMLAHDMTQVQIADELGLTVRAVNRRLAHFRQRVANPIRPQNGRKPIGSKRPIRSNGLHRSNRGAVA